MSQTAKPRQLYTRHYMAIISGVLSVLITVLGAAHDNIPALSQYLEVTGIPDAILIVDWIAARVKDSKGLGGVTLGDIQTLIATIEDMKSKFPPIVKPASTPTS